MTRTFGGLFFSLHFTQPLGMARTRSQCEQGWLVAASFSKEDNSSWRIKNYQKEQLAPANSFSPPTLVLVPIQLLSLQLASSDSEIAFLTLPHVIGALKSASREPHTLPISNVVNTG